MRRRRSDSAQLQLLESITVAVFIFVAIATVAVFRIPTSPATFQLSELEKKGSDVWKVRQAKIPSLGDDCNESPCPFSSDLDRLLSLALGYRGRTPIGDGSEDPDAAELSNFLSQGLGSGTKHIVQYSNGYATTQLTPVGLRPPASDVVVARTTISPNWTVHWSLYDGFKGDLGLNLTAPAIPLGVRTHFEIGATDRVLDPLNRTENERGFPMSGVLAQTVPLNATLGLYLHCQGASFATCFPFFVVPPSTAPQGSLVSADTASRVGRPVPLGTFDSLARVGTASDDLGLYLDLDSTGTVTAGDVRLSPRVQCQGNDACPPGTIVVASDNDASPPSPLGTLATQTGGKIHYVADGATIDASTRLYLDFNGNDRVDPGDYRLSRTHVYPMGLIVEQGQWDNDTAATDNVSAVVTLVVFDDLDADGVFDADEPLFLDIREDGQGPAVEAFDFHLTPIGLPSARFDMELRLEMWYGV